MIIAQGKAGEAAALGKRRPTPNLSFFQLGLARFERQTQLEKREEIMLCP